jgi:hypothetical protein
VVPSPVITHVAVRRLYLRLLAIVYACAFGSLLPQISGLIGANGILPVREWLEAVRLHTGIERYWLAPTLCWLNASDTFLYALCIVGLGAAVLVFLEYAVVPALVMAWLAYLSLAVAGQDFLGFQWDALLLEAGFVSIFLAAPGFGRRSRGAVPLITIWLLRWLCFRLMFGSGLVKLLSGDPTWRGLTALQFHYETQPLPNPLAWYAHRLPHWWQSFSVVQMFAIELLVPFLIFAGRRARNVAAAALVALQLAIAATGNYAFFNLLAIALCVPLLDDLALPRRWRQEAGTEAGRSWPRSVLLTLAAVIGTLSSVLVAATIGLGAWIPRPVVQLYRLVAPFDIVNHYGLFAVMTTTRPEIIIEGSDDGEHWQAYEFRFKPGDLRRMPPVVAPHQPRLDWQMWFAALGEWEQSPWFAQLESRLLEAQPAVLSLLAHDPFAGRPPAFVRARLFRYHFSTAAERARDGSWWTREESGPYGPTLARRQ